MGIIDYETLKRQGEVRLICDFKKVPSGKEKSHWVRLSYELIFGRPAEYKIVDYNGELFRSENFEEAVNFYNDLYLKYKG